MEVTFEWEEPDNTVPGYVPTEYFILLRPIFEMIPFNFRVKNATNITIFPLNATQVFFAYVSYLAQWYFDSRDG